MDSYKMSKTQLLGILISQRLTAAAEEIFEAVERTMEEYEEKVNKSNLEIDRQRKLLDIILNPHIKLHREDFQQQHNEQEKSPSLAQKDPEPPQRDHNLWTGQGVEKLRELEEADILSAIVSNQITPESDGEGCGEPQSPRDFQPHSEIKKIKTEEGDGDNDLMQDSITLTSKESQPLGKGLRSADSTKGSSDCSTLALHEDTTVFCKVCGFPCSSDNALLQHVQTHATTGSRVCGMFLESPDRLMRHLPSHRQKTSSSCDSYSPMRRKIQNRFKLNKTESLNTEKKVMKEKSVEKGVLEGKYILCSVCGRYLISKSNISEHMRTHTGEKPHRCEVCGSMFKDLTCLRKHRRSHTEEKPYRCDVCGRFFRVKKNMRLHRYTHTEERPFRCSVCGMGFKQPTTLTNHKAVHTMEKPHRCDVCGIAFGLRKILVEHLKSKKHLKAVSEKVSSQVE